MRHLLQPRVLNRAAIASLVSALACYPRLSLWLHGPGPVWYLETIVFVCCLTLWGFVFAWHEPYTGRPVFVFKLDPGPLIVAGLTGIGAATAFHIWLDPPLRAKFPEEFPADLQQWLANVLFTFGLSQLFMVFAVCDWLMRLTKNRWVTMTFVGLLGASVQAMKFGTLATPVPHWQMALLLAVRFGGGFLAAFFYLRGGIFLVWWWVLLLESRWLLDLER